MSNRIDSTSGGQSMMPSEQMSVDENMSTDSTSANMSTDSTSANMSTDAQVCEEPADYSTDDWEYGPDEGEEFMSQMSGGEGGQCKAPPASSESMSVMELQAQSAAAAPKDDFANNPMAEKIKDVLTDADIDFESIQHSNLKEHLLGPIQQKLLENLTPTERKQLTEILADPEKGKAFLREVLTERSDIPDGWWTDRSEALDEAVDAVFEKLTNKVVDDFERRVAGRVETIVRKAKEPYESINASSESRRAFLAQLAQLEGDPEKLQARLEAFGIEEDAAGEIAQILADAHGDPDAIQALLSGEEGPDRPGWHVLEDGDAYDHAEDLLQEQLGDKLEAMDALAENAGNGEITGSILTNDNFKGLREQVLNEMEGSTDGPLSEVVARKTEEVASDEFVSDVIKIGISAVAAVGLTVMTAGLGTAAAIGAGALTGAVESAPDVLVAWQDVDLAEMAAQKDVVMPDGRKVEIGMTDQETVAKARHNRNITTAFAVAGLVLGAAHAGEAASKKIVRDAVAEAAIEGGKSVSMGTSSTLVSE